ncbi:thiol reductant ABC exporter subunit CydD [Nocardioides sp. JQ2195]|uniref:thiol reductant ABC exporter subunit CydD n=1 Tax=Nocardioides sp. JQ2195 TaxID=2592334 RepID=UPI00143E191A|nr:thiol reductant ABC exporter subunit CydD [Nocardioides sp. JQ2195]QIX27025.1 thiol reductant ABC exporter subunit CydD [Nocardioides sp. JQ2195]
MKPLDPQVLPHLAPARRPLAVVVGGNVLTGLLVVAQAFAGAALVAGVLDAPSGTGWHAAAWWFAGITVLRAVLGRVVDAAAARAAGQVGVHLRDLVLRSALAQSSTDLGRRRRGELTTLATRGVAAVEPYLTRYLPALVLAVVLPVITLVAIAAQDWLSALIVLLTLPLLPVFAVLIGMTTRDKADRQWRALGTLAGHFLDVVRGLPTLVAHRRAEAQTAQIRAVTDRHRRATVDTLKLAFASSAALELIATISVALVAVCVGLRLAGGSLDLRTALTVLLLAPEAYWPIRRVGAEFHAAAEGTATFTAITHLTRTGSSCVANGQFLSSEQAVVDASPRTIRLDDVSLAWPDREPVVSGLSARLLPGTITAVVGPSGCGKSTLLHTLLGELPVAGGMLRAGGDDLAAVRRTSWQARVAHLPQRPWLVADTIAANLRLGRPEATEAELYAALATVDLAGLVFALPDGLATRLGDEGLGLSAGQRARLALARVVLAERPYVLLDEPTAHLDADTERIMLDVIRMVAETSTVVVVAHRQAVVDVADHVIDLATVAVDAPRPHELTGAGGGPGALPGDEPGNEPGDGTGAESGAVPARGDALARRPAPARRTQRSAPVDAAGPGVGKRRLDGAWGWALTAVLATLGAASGVALTATAGWLIARSAEQPPILMLTVAIVGVRTFGLARPALHYVERLLGHDLALRELAERRAGVFARLVPLVPGRTGRHGDVLTGVVDDVDSHLDDLLRVRLPIASWLGVTAIAGTLAWFLLPLAVLPVVGVALLGGGATLLIARAGARRHETAFVDARAEVGRRSADLIGSARQWVVWGAAERALSEADVAGKRLARSAQGSVAGVAVGRAVALLSAGLGTVAVAFIGAPGLAEGAISGPMLALLLLLPLALAEVTAPLADAGALLVRTSAAQARLTSLTGLDPAVSEPTAPASLDGSPAISVRNASLGWRPDEEVLQGLDLDLPPGRRIGITGPSGSGKSTLALALLKLLPVRAGHHDLGSIPVADLDGDDVRRVVGLLDDDPYLFGSTLVENVRLARPSATDGEVADALRAAHLGDWVDGLADGIHTRVGDGGVEVSGGERARIGLARAVLAGRDVLVLDEPTAHLDAATARAVADDLLSASAGRSIVWITHDTVGLAEMDEILDLGAGAELVVPATG